MAYGCQTPSAQRRSDQNTKNSGLPKFAPLVARTSLGPIVAYLSCSAGRTHFAWIKSGEKVLEVESLLEMAIKEEIWNFPQFPKDHERWKFCGHTKGSPGCAIKIAIPSITRTSSAAYRLSDNWAKVVTIEDYKAAKKILRNVDARTCSSV